MNTIKFTEKKLSDLKESYQLAVDTGADIFTFEGNELLTSYAKYLIEYIELVMKRGESP